MAPPIKSNKQGGGTPNLTGKINPNESSSETMSNNLWVGNLAANVTDSDLRILFQRYGAVDSITVYPSKNYAFVYLRRPEDATSAKFNLQGVALRGSPLKIEFAKPARPCKSLWVSGISSSISKEDLEDEFSKFGKIEDFRFLRDKNTAYIDYFRLEDASKALKVMNGKKKGGVPIRVDYLRSHSRRDQGPEFHEPKEGQHFRSMAPLDSPWLPQDPVRNISVPLSYGPQRPQHVLPSDGRKGDGEQPTNVLLISYPPSVHIDEQMLHNAMILFGEIEKIRSVPARHCSFVEFRSVEEAQRAKDGLQGHLFNDPRILITFSNGELAPSKDFTGFIPGVKGQRPDALFNELPFQAAQLDLYGQPPVGPNSFHGRLTPRGVGGPDISMRPFAPSGSLEPVRPGREFILPDPHPINAIGGPNWRRASPTQGILSSPPASRNPSTRPAPGTWDIFDASQIQRESKRLRTDGATPLIEMKNGALESDHAHKVVPQVKSVSPLHPRSTTRGTDLDRPDPDYMWRGVIAKGGTPVCHARCVPIGNWVGYEIPEIVNCSARTGLDLLAKHYIDAVGFDIIFFLPDSEDDFASYTEFLRYLGDRNRAGVAKFDDGTTLFLVPPSEFLTKVLNVSGPERLYGVVLKFPQHASVTPIVGPSTSQPQYIDKLQVPPRNDYGVMSQEERVLQIDHSGVGLPHEDSTHPKPLTPPISNFQPLQVVPPVTSAATPLTGLTLTPELIATLASLTKANSNSQQPSASNTMVGPVSTSAVPDERSLPGWEYEREPVAITYHSRPQILPQHEAYPSNIVNESHLAITGNSHIQDLAFSLPIPDAVPSMTTSSSFQAPPQNGHFAIPLQTSQQYQPYFPQDTHTSYGFEQKRDVPPAFNPGTNLVASLNQAYGGANVYQPQSMVPEGVENSSLQLPEQMQQFQSALYRENRQISEIEADKNERYQSTVQLAANLLFQIHQQPGGTQAGQGGGHQ